MTGEIKATPLVTIAIPCYKTRYLREALTSALNQTYRNIEVLVVNDRSPHDVKSIIDEFHDDRLVYHENKKNLGAGNPANNWNECVRLAKGEFFCLLCDDDVYDVSMVETMVELSNKYPDCNVFRARADLRNAKWEVVDKYPSSPEWESMEDYMWHVARGFRRQTISEWMLRTATLRQYDGYALLPLAWYADYLSIFRLSKSGGIASSNKILMHFRQSGINLSSRDNENTEKKLLAAKMYIDEVETLISDSSEYDVILNATKSLVKAHSKYHMGHAKIKVLLKLYPDRRKYGIHSKEIRHAILHHKK